MKYLLVLNGATTNRGCEAILISTHKLISEFDSTAQFVNSSVRDDRAAQEDYLRLPSLRHRCHPKPFTLSWAEWQFHKRVRRHRFNFERYLGWADVVLSLGGDNYSLDYGTVENYLDANDRVLAHNKRLVIWGASIGPFTATPTVEQRVREQFPRAHAIVARETGTVEYLRSIGIERNVRLMADPAFRLPKQSFPISGEIERILENGCIGLNLSPLLARYRDSPHTWSDEAAGYVQALVKELGQPLLLVPHVIEPGNDDESFMRDVLARTGLGSESAMLLSASKLSSLHLKSIISRLQCFIGARTHATIASLSSCVPTISIGYSAKARGINRDIFGSDVWILDHRTMTPESLVARTRALLAEEKVIRGHLQNWVRANSPSVSQVNMVMQ